MQQRYSAAGRFFDALHSIRRDLAHAVRSLFKERTFTLVCVVSLGIGMGAIAESTAVAVAGSLVLLLAALRIVGVVGFMVATRTREIAVRMALGSSRLRVFRMMLADIVRLVVPGVAGGLLLAAVLIRTMEGVMGTPLIVGPTPLGVMELVIYLAASTIAVCAALLAGLPAARRATTVQPMVAMRSE
jgi:putative ABC transport system permease protein